MNEPEKCDQCTEATKKPAAFWDKFSAGGTRFDCDNQTCLVKQERVQRQYEQYRNHIYAAEENKRNGIDLSVLAEKETKSGTLLIDRAQHIGIGPAEYCAYSMGKKPMPPELYRKVIEFLDNKIRTENRKDEL